MPSRLVRFVDLTRCLLLLTLALPACGCGMGAGYRQNQIGKRQFDAGDYTAARRSFERAMINHPYNSDYAYNVAAAMERQGDSLAAEQMYEHALTIDPSHQPSYRAMANLLVEEGRSDEAHELITAWTEAQPQNPETRIEMAWLQQRTAEDFGMDDDQGDAYAERPEHRTRWIRWASRIASRVAMDGQRASMVSRRSIAASR
ncbi:MAG: tetratricopeptide repeat protein [Planctomycetaceae bacterium]